MRFKQWILVFAWLGACLSATGQSAQRDPRVGYVYPAGARRGTTVNVFAGGRYLKAMKGVWISGDGVSARIIKNYRPLRNLDKGQRALLKWHVDCRIAKLKDGPVPAKPGPPKPLVEGTPAPKVELPEHPLLDLLDELNLRQIRHWQTLFQRYNRKQPSPQIGEMVWMEVKVASNAVPGMRELRFRGPQGLTNPLRFEIGTLGEVREWEPNEKNNNPTAPPPPVAKLPCTFNGQIQAGDVDLFRFSARRGQRLVVKGEARSLIPYLADAVPGWFQMVMALRDSEGKELAYGDCFRFNPDPVLFCKIPEDGEYVLEIRDSIYRGREDFVYRVSIGELPFITAQYPLGGREGKPLVAKLRGWNLPKASLQLNTQAGGDPIRSARVPSRVAPSNTIRYAVNTLPESLETEPNDDFDQAGTISFPSISNGLIAQPGDADVFQIDGRKGCELVVEVQARRLGSPLDSVVHVADESGTILGWNDDSMEKDGHLHLGDGLLTHHADSRVRVTLPADGPVFIRIADTQLHGGPEYGYRIHVRELQPDFEIRVTPSVLNIRPGGHVPLRVHVLRNDGFEGEILLKLEGAPPGFELSGARIPAGEKEARFTLGVPLNAKPGEFSPRLIGSAEQAGTVVSRKAFAADDMMQAFLWRHLVEAEKWWVAVAPGRGKSPLIKIESPRTIRVPVGGAAQVRVTVPKWVVARGILLAPNDAPPGISLSAVRPTRNGVEFDIKADATALKPGLESNLIIDLIGKAVKAKKSGAKAKMPYKIGVLPAIPIKLIKPVTP